MLVEKLKPWVTSFSEAIPYKYKHGDEIWVGGEIIDIYTIPEGLLFDEANDDIMHEATYITIDDGVGVNHLAVPKKAFQKHSEVFDISVGKIILAQGKVFELDISERKKGKVRKIENHPEGTIRILCWRLLPLPEGKAEPQPGPLEV